MEKPMLISLTQGKSTKVSPEDFEYLNQFKWHYHSKGYATRCIREKNNWKKRKQILMHRIILARMGIKVPKYFVADHKNRNKLDNRRSNLRILTSTQSNFNRGGKMININNPFNYNFI
jgi:hypothetical protein